MKVIGLPATCIILNVLNLFFRFGFDLNNPNGRNPINNNKRCNDWLENPKRIKRSHLYMNKLCPPSISRAKGLNTYYKENHPACNQTDSICYSFSRDMDNNTVISHFTYLVILYLA